MQNLSFYLKAAEKAIMAWGYPYMLKDEDCIADVAYAMMKADQDFDGTGSIYGFRGQRARFAIMSIKSAHAKRRRHLSLNYEYDNASLLDLIADNKSTESIDMRDRLESTPCLTSREKQLLIGYFYEGRNMPELAEKLDVSKQRIQQILEATYLKLRTAWSE